MIKTYEDALFDLCERDRNLIVMTAENRAAIRGLPDRLGDRFIDVGIAEQTLVGVAAGIALAGRPVVVHALATFLLLRAFEFVRTDIGFGNLPVVLVGAVPGLLSEANGPTHQAIEDVALMRAIPTMNIVCPSDAAELPLALEAAVSSKRATYLRFCARPTSRTPAPYELGVAETLAEGGDATILTYGTLLAEALEAVPLLQERGITTRVVNLRSLRPFDERALMRAVLESRLVVTLEDHFESGGLYTIVAETLLACRQTARVLPLSLGSTYFRPALFDKALDAAGLSTTKIVDRIATAFATEKGWR